MINSEHNVHEQPLRWPAVEAAVAEQPVTVESQAVPVVEEQESEQQPAAEEVLRLRFHQAQRQPAPARQGGDDEERQDRPCPWNKILERNVLSWNLRHEWAFAMPTSTAPMTEGSVPMKVSAGNPQDRAAGKTNNLIRVHPKTRAPV